ncbi:hypothetical protein OCS_06765 [Ophiocordyceps sinensis CO18]|uniref:Uncharacterized protein n=1 Tax=Ophiocordyceps sinensis (strain Co18 / CGMCC 3.14243) TaxID=911162 RepID=T5A6T1_OPHSC|nr:hypothetical protein OCS_06765 [Ophiocordyceps sinensis CO18]
MAAKPAQLRAGSAKVMPAATLQVKPWRSPRAGGANVDTGEKDTSRHTEPDALPSSHLDNARPAVPARAMERERADKILKAAKPTNEIRQDVFQTSIAHDVREAASPCSMQEGTDEVPLTKSKAPAERTQETSLPLFAREQPLAPQKAEPRTELRIRPRQRRGLLMMSAKHAHPRDAHARPPSRPASTRPSPKASPRLGPLELGSPFEAPEAQDAIWSGSEASASCHAAPDLADSSSQNDVALIDAIRRRRVASIDAESSSDDEVLDQRQRANSRRVPESDDDGSEGQEEHPSRARGGERRRTRCTSGDEPDSSPEPPARKSTRRSCRRIKNTEQKAENPAPSRPRITKMARKSVRSREIIGYIPPVEDDMVPALFAASARRNALWANPVLSVGSTCASAPPAVIAERGGEAKARPRGNVAPLPLALEPDREEADPETKPDANVEAAAMPAIAPLKKPVGTMTPEEAPPKEPTKASMPAAEPPKELAGVTMAEPASPGREAAQGQGPNRNPDADNGPRPRMSNPATRGKKATRKEDAAGHPLQNLVPMEPAPARAAPAPTVEPKRPESVLPGFSRANGGAWSKHAEDLLGMTRPTERTRGR